MSLRLPPGNRAPVRALAAFEALDGPAAKLGEAARAAIPEGPVKDALSGSWLGHPLHPLLTDFTIGAFTSALVLDWLGGERSAPAAQRLIGLGVLSAGTTATSGYSDWADTQLGNPSARRIGVVHAATNLAASSLFAASWLARRRGRSGRMLALVGGAAMSAAGYLGGHMTFAEGVGVDRTAFEDAPEDWVDVLAEDALAEGEKTCVPVLGTPVMVARVDGELYALSDHCAHRGGPLHEGELKDGTITCPWHHSVFEVKDGTLVHGPAAYPQPAWDTRVREGRVEVRRR
jgi:nitrite reductase/ring-hydroxylating ferredoxin subunit/uncharacterized membrane protein